MMGLLNIEDPNEELEGDKEEEGLIGINDGPLCEDRIDHPRELIDNEGLEAC